MHTNDAPANPKLSADQPADRADDLAAQVFADLNASPAHRRFDWEVVKQNQLRTVHRVTTPDGVVYAKQHLATGFVQRIKGWFIGNPAQRESDAGKFAKTHGIPCVDLFAVSTVNSGGVHSTVSLSHSIEHARSLSDEFSQPGVGDRAANRRVLGEAVALFLATAHNATFLHADDHAGNILVRKGVGGNPECHYVDVYGARCGAEVTRTDAAFSLASLGQWFLDRTSKSERLRVINRYVHLRGWPTTRATRRSFVRQIDDASKSRRNKLYRKRDKRILCGNAHFGRFALGGGWRAYITRRFRSQPIFTGAQIPDWQITGLADHLREVFGLSEYNRKTDTVTNGPGDSIWFTSNMRETWSWRWFGSPARQRYVMACKAMNRDIPVALPVGLAEKSSGIGIQCAKQMTARPPQCVPIQSLLNELPSDSKRALLEKTGRLLAMTFMRGLVVTNISPTRIEVTCLNGEEIPMWAGIVGCSTSIRLSVPTQVWLLGILATEARNCGLDDRIQMARVLRACVRTMGMGTQWKAMWRDICDSNPLLNE